MKLASKYNQVNMIISLAILLVTAVCYYLVIHFILTGELDKDLSVEELEIAEYAKLHHELPPPGNFKEQIVSYKRLNGGGNIKRQFLDREYLNIRENENEPGRSLITGISLNGEHYQITITKSRVEAEYLIQIIFLISLLVTVLLLISIALINKFVLHRLWKPFHTILEQMKDFKVSDGNTLQTHATQIDEFSELNRAAIQMSVNARNDYSELKGFTDNASHEIMTPLAVINSKLDSLLQTGPFNSTQGEILEDIYKGIGRLSRLNQSLLLLSKIDNKLIHDDELIDLKELIEGKLKQFSELIQSQQLQVHVILDEKRIMISRYLADILLNNLLSNAIRHNSCGGGINIELNDKQMSISNAADGKPLDKRIFERFYKTHASEGMGLGLSISMQICEGYGVNLKYDFLDNRHCFSIIF